MQTRLTFQSLRRAIETSLLCPPTRDALEQLAKRVPSGTGPQADLLETILFVDDSVWRFRSSTEARKFADLLECYFRTFDPEYRVSAQEPVTIAVHFG